MNIGLATTNRILTCLTATVIGGLAGQAYLVVGYDTIPLEILKTWPGFRGGAVIAGLASAFEMFVMRGTFGAWLRRRAFATALLIRVSIHTVLIVCGLLANRLLSGLIIGQFVSNAFESRDIMQDTIYSFLVVGLVLFVLQMRTLIGGRTLLNVVLGRYRRPVREERLFILVDLTGSTPLAEKIGDERFHEFLSAFFFETDAAIVELGGEIYSYIGDAMIASWPLGDPVQNTKAIEAIFAMRLRLIQHDPWFKARFDAAPQFRAVLHGGSIVAGECGDSRRQITYLGDVLNTTARLEALSKRLGIDNLISSYLLDRVKLPKGIVVEDLGPHKLKGVAEPVTVHALTKLVL